MIFTCLSENTNQAACFPKQLSIIIGCNASVNIPVFLVLRMQNPNIYKEQEASICINSCCFLGCFVIWLACLNYTLYCWSHGWLRAGIWRGECSFLELLGQSIFILGHFSLDGCSSIFSCLQVHTQGKCYSSFPL